MNTILSTSDYDIDSFSEYIDDVNNMAYHHGLQVSGTNPDTFSIEADPSYFYDYPPTFSVTTELDSDGETNYITFLPIVDFPVLDASELNFSDSMHSIIERWADVGEFVNQLIKYPYSIDM